MTRQNAAQALYYLLTDERISRNKYENYTDIIGIELENYCFHKKLGKSMYANIKVKSKTYDF